jgi:hypothetical protein
MGRRRRLSAAAFGIGLLATLVGAAGAATPLVKVTDAPSPFPPGCDGVAADGANYANSEVEVRVAVDPRNPAHAVGVWQQDRWSTGGAHGLVAATTHDGLHWSRSFAPFSRCAGGTAANGGDYPRASDPWVDFAPNGDVYQASLSVNLQDVTTAVLVSRSADGGATWQQPVTLRRDTGDAFNDKESVTADPTDPAGRRVYVVWDRLEGAGLPAGAAAASPLPLVPSKGPAWLARTVDGGATWEPARPIYDPGPGQQTIGNQIVVLPDGTLIDGFAVGSGGLGRDADGGRDGGGVDPARGLEPDATTRAGPGDELPGAGDLPSDPEARNLAGFAVAVMRSSDHGATWSAPTVIDQIRPGENSARLRAGQILPTFAVDPATGTVAAVWLDGRFDPSRRAAVALATSTDAGRTWTPPRRVSQTPAAGDAVLPSVAFAPDGTLGVSYYDFRNRPVSSTAITTDAWLATCPPPCTQGATWHESHLGGPFDAAKAPDSGGAFLGDYEGLVGIGPGRFRAFFVEADPGSSDDPTNVFSTEAG